METTPGTEAQGPAKCPSENERDPRPLVRDLSDRRPSNLADSLEFDYDGVHAWERADSGRPSFHAEAISAGVVDGGRDETNNVEEIRRRNIRSVHELYDAERRRDIRAWEELWAEDGRCTFWLSSPTPPVVGRKKIVRAAQRKFKVFPPYGIGVIVEPMADPTRALVRLHLTMTEPAGATEDQWCLFHFDERGRITEIEQISDTASGRVNRK